MNPEEALQIIQDWNTAQEFISRKGYEKKIKQFRDSKEIIALIGVRRSGKSTLLRQEIEDLKKTYDSSQVLFLNLEDPRITKQPVTQTLDTLFETFKNYIYSKGQIYLFLDEIQNITGWEQWVRTKQELGQAQIYITGSSSKLLSQELATVLTGRSFKLHVMPLSFKEFITFRKTSRQHTKKELFDLYLKEGGFPKVAILPQNIKQAQLQEYFETILLKDVVARKHISNSYALSQTALYLISNSAKLYSANKIRQALSISLETALNYIQYLKETQLFFDCEKYDTSLKRQQASQKKIYCADTGIINANAFKISQDTGRILENAVFIELKQKGKHAFYHKENYECDFVIKEDLSISQAIQVCHHLNDKNKKRECNGLLEAMDKYGLNEGLLLTHEQEEIIEKNSKKIYVKPAWKWMLE